MAVPIVHPSLSVQQLHLLNAASPSSHCTVVATRISNPQNVELPKQTLEHADIIQLPARRRIPIVCIPLGFDQEVPYLLVVSIQMVPF
jgi:hypothetical protein